MTTPRVQEIQLSFVLALLVAASLNFVMPAQAQHKAKRSNPETFYRAPKSMVGKNVILPIGTTFEGRMSKTISSVQSQAGESFAIVLSSPVLANGSEVVIPAGSQVVGEVVEAIPSKTLPKQKRMQPRGKLRVQISQLRTPDGVAYPLVGSLIGEEGAKGKDRLTTPLGHGVGFVGTSSAFEAVAPGMNRYARGGGGQQGNAPSYVRKREFLADEIYGTGGDKYNAMNDARRIRSLVLRKHDYWIDAGSPLTVRLGAPLRLAVTPANMGAAVEDEEEQEEMSESALPEPSANSSGTDIPPITNSNSKQSNSQSNSNLSSAPVKDPQTSPPPAQEPAQSSQPRRRVHSSADF